MPLRLLGIGDAGSIHTIRWAERLAERGHAVDIVSGRPGAWEVPNVTVHDLRRLDLLTRIPRLRRLRLARAIGNLAARLDPDVVHAHGLLPYGLWAAQAKLHPLVVSPWGRDALVDAKQEPGRSRARSAIAAADYLVVNSQAILDASVELGADPERALLTLWHARLDGFGPERGDRAGLRAELGWPEDAFVVLSLRNFQPKRNIDVLVRAFDRVRREEAGARLLLAALGGETKAEIEALVERLGLGDLVRFVRLEADDVPRFAASADVTVTISDHDSASAALLEAMASEQPVVGGWCPSIDEWIGPGEGAEMIEPRDEDGLVKALLRLLRDPDLRRRYGRRNGEVARARVEEAGPALEALYRELAARRTQTEPLVSAA